MCVSGYSLNAVRTGRRGFSVQFRAGGTSQSHCIGCGCVGVGVMRQMVSREPVLVKFQTHSIVISPYSLDTFTRSVCEWTSNICAINGFAFINLLNPDQNSFEDVPFSLLGRARQDVRVTQCNRGCK